MGAYGSPGGARSPRTRRRIPVSLRFGQPGGPAMPLRSIPTLLLAAGALLAGCGRHGRGPVLILSGSAVGAEGEVLARQVGRFRAANPGLPVEVQSAPDDATERHQL